MDGMGDGMNHNGKGMDMGHHHDGMEMSTMMMHMTLYWGKNAEVLFSGWPGRRSGMYVLALIVVFAMAVLIEWISHCRLIKSAVSNNVAAGIAQTVLHTIRMGVAYLLMLALMSFNGGIFIAGVAGHAVGFLLFASRAFKRTDSPPYEKQTDLPPISC